MKIKMMLAAAMVVTSTGGAMAAAHQIDFSSALFGPTGCGMSIKFSDLKISPEDPKSLAAAKPTGECQGDGNAIGGIGNTTVFGERGTFLTLGQNIKGSGKRVLLYVIQLQLNTRKLIEGNTGIWALFDTTNGEKVNILDGGTYSYTPPAAGVAAK
jgi:hypothetical protein